MIKELGALPAPLPSPRVYGIGISPLYVIPGPAPSLQNSGTFTDYIARHNAIAVTTKLVDAIYVAGFIVFISGFRQLIKNASGNDAWIADLVFGAGLVHAAIVLVGDIVAGGAALDILGAPDPTAVRALTEASLVAFGAIGFLMTAFLAAASYAILKVQLARLLGWAGYILAALNVAAVPTIYKGNDFLATELIVLVKDDAAFGISGGQQSRVDLRSSVAKARLWCSLVQHAEHSQASLICRALSA